MQHPSIQQIEVNKGTMHLVEPSGSEISIQGRETMENRNYSKSREKKKRISQNTDDLASIHGHNINMENLMSDFGLKSDHIVDPSGIVDPDSVDVTSQHLLQSQNEQDYSKMVDTKKTQNGTSLSQINPGYDVTTIDGVVYNNKGYEICGQLNQHNKPCQRIGNCPFHQKKDPPKEKKAPPPGIKKGQYKHGWTKDEHIRFLNGLQIHGKGAWKEISLIVGTRTPTQIQSHAQKYYLRQKQNNKNKRSIHDTTIDDLQDLQQETRSSVPSKQANHNTRGTSVAPPYSYSNMISYAHPSGMHPAQQMNHPSPGEQMMFPYLRAEQAQNYNQRAFHQSQASFPAISSMTGTQLPPPSVSHVSNYPGMAAMNVNSWFQYHPMNEISMVHNHSQVNTPDGKDNSEKENSPKINKMESKSSNEGVIYEHTKLSQEKDGSPLTEDDEEREDSVFQQSIRLLSKGTVEEVFVLLAGDTWKKTLLDFVRDKLFY